MPPRFRLSGQQLSITELPILPFLAPSVFTPWPIFQIRRQLATSTQQNHALQPHTRTETSSVLVADSSIGNHLEYREADQASLRQIASPTEHTRVAPSSSGRHVCTQPLPTTYRNLAATKQHTPCQTSQRSNQKGNTQCRICKTSFRTKVELKKHIASEHDRNPAELGQGFRRPGSQYGVLNEFQAPPAKPIFRHFRGTWMSEFSKLSMKYIPSRIGEKPQKVRVKSLSLIQSAAFDLAHAPSSKHVRELWIEMSGGAATMSRSRSSRLWISVMLLILQDFPDKALKVLLAIHDMPYVPGNAVGNCLEYIACFYFQSQSNDSKVDVADIATILLAVEQILLQRKYGSGGNPHQTELVKVTSKTVYLLQLFANGEQLVRLYDVLRLTNQALHENTSLHIITSLARQGETLKALELLRHIHSMGTDFSKPAVESVCCTVLQKKFQKPHSSLPDSELFAELLQMGLQPNLIFYNVLIGNATRSGDPETAWLLHDMLVDINVQPDGHTYSLLLNDAKNRSDKEASERTYQIIQEKGAETHHITTDILHAVYLFHEAEIASREAEAMTTGNWSVERTVYPSAFIKMLPLFQKYYDTQPLSILLPSGALPVAAAPAEEAHKTAPVAALVVMIVAYLKRNPTQAAGLYYRFRLLVLEGHPSIVPLAHSSRIYDAILMSLGSSFETLPLCAKVVSDMLSHGHGSNPTLLGAEPDKTSSSISQEEKTTAFSESSDSFKPALVDTKSGTLAKPIMIHCTPSVHTWSILLKIYMDHSQPLAAEKVIELMEYHSIKPNQVTWNSLVIGYANKQDIQGIVGAVVRMQENGYTIDHYATHAFSRIQQRVALQKALERMTTHQHSKKLQSESLSGQRRLILDLVDIGKGLADSKLWTDTSTAQAHSRPEEPYEDDVQSSSDSPAGNEVLHAQPDETTEDQAAAPMRRLRVEKDACLVNRASLSLWVDREEAVIHQTDNESVGDQSQEFI